jgi:hypothetical protein
MIFRNTQFLFDHSSTVVGLEESAQVICQAYYNGITVFLRYQTPFVYSLLLLDVLARYESIAKCKAHWSEVP